MPPPRKAPGVGHKVPKEQQQPPRNQRSRATKKQLSALPGDAERKVMNVASTLLSVASRRESHASALSLENYGEAKTLDQHSQAVLKGFEVMWRQNILCDVTIVINNHRVRAHKALLSTCAEYFRNLFSSSPEESQLGNCEVCLEGITVLTAEVLIESMYTGKIQVSEGNVRELLAAASSLKYASIEEACDEFLRKRLNKSNCLRMLNLAFMYCLADLTDEALHMSAEHFKELSGGFDFFQLEIDQLIAIICRDDLKAESELEIFRSVLSWLEFDKKSRLQYATPILCEIRLPLLMPLDIVDHVETVEYLMSDPDCQKFVKEALHYHCLPARQTLLQTIRTGPRIRKFDTVLSIGGAPRLKSDPVSQDISYLDPETSTWSVLTQLKEPRHHHAVAVLNGFLYVAGGEETNDQRSPLNTAFRYDPRSNQWLQIASMKKRRESFQLGVLNALLYAVGGRVDQSESLAEVERYNPSIDKWEMVAPLSSPRRSVAVTAHNGRLYAMGGSGNKRISSRNERYNPLIDQWEARRSLSSPRFFAMVASVGNKLFLMGGATLDHNGSVVCAKKVEGYVPLTDTWMVFTGMNEPRAEASCAVLGSSIYVVGGYSWDANKRLDSTEIYDSETDLWTFDTPIAGALTGIACCTLTLYDPGHFSDDTAENIPQENLNSRLTFNPEEIEESEGGEVIDEYEEEEEEGEESGDGPRSTMGRNHSIATEENFLQAPMGS